MRIPNAEHEAHPWVIARVAPDFQLLDAWALPAEGAREEFATLLDGMASLDPADGDSRAARALFWLRWRLGACFGWDESAEERPIPGCTETTLGARLSEDLRAGAMSPDLSSNGTLGRFTPLYRTDDEWAAELSNGTVHGVLQLAWVDRGAGLYRGQMGVYVKPRGRLGAAYMALIGPFRHLIVYPAVMRQVAHAWEARPRAEAPL